MDLTAYRNKEIEKARTVDLIGLIPADSHDCALDVGAREGWFSILLAEKFSRVAALDLKMPAVSHPNIECIQGDICHLHFPDDAFDLIFCAEVLEHIASEELKKACSELERVAKSYILVGVPYKQDIRVARTKCQTCGTRNPPWGHVNSFDDQKLKSLFPQCDVIKRSFVGENRDCTNAISVALMDYAENPYGTYHQEEVCINCGCKLLKPPERDFLQ